MHLEFLGEKTLSRYTIQVLLSLFKRLLVVSIFAVCISSHFREVENSAKIKPTQQLPDIRQVKFRGQGFFGEMQMVMSQEIHM